MFAIDEVVRRLRRQGSDTHDVEAKSAAGGMPTSIVQTLSAFANMPGGGRLILGLDESRGFAAVRVDVVALKKAVASIARQALVPPLQIDLVEVPFEGQTLLVVDVGEVSPSAKPCRVGRTGKAYLRSWDGDFELSEVEVQGFLLNRTQPRFDIEPVDGATRHDLSRDLVADYLALARMTDRKLARIDDDEVLLRKTGVLTRSDVPTVAGLLALGDYPQEWFPNFVIQAAAAPEPGAVSTVRVGDVARFSGPIPEMIDDALTWIARHTRHRIVDSADGRVRDQFDFPPVAVRELLSNALVHRDLGEWAWSRAVELRVDDAGLRLVNPGGLFGVTVSRLFENQMTSARNLALTRICQFVKLRDGRVVEALATGMPKILESTIGDGLPSPRFFDQGVAFTAILTRPSASAVPNGPVTPPRAASPSVITVAEKRVLDALGQRPLAQAELASMLGLSAQSTLRHLRHLRAKGRVEINGGAGQRLTTYRRVEG